VLKGVEFRYEPGKQWSRVDDRGDEVFREIGSHLDTSFAILVGAGTRNLRQSETELELRIGRQVEDHVAKQQPV
jgi:hypothetical protein